VCNEYVFVLVYWVLGARARPPPTTCTRVTPRAVPIQRAPAAQELHTDSSHAAARAAPLHLPHHSSRSTIYIYTYSLAAFAYAYDYSSLYIYTSPITPLVQCARPCPGLKGWGPCLRPLLPRPPPGRSHSSASPVQQPNNPGHACCVANAPPPTLHTSPRPRPGCPARANQTGGQRQQTKVHLGSGVSARAFRGPRASRELSARFPRAFRELSARFPRGFREVSERFPASILRSVD